MNEIIACVMSFLKNNATIIISAAAAIAAILSFIISNMAYRAQKATDKKQIELSEEQEKLAKEQYILSKEQARIAKQQNRISMYKERIELYKDIERFFDEWAFLSQIVGKSDDRAYLLTVSKLVLLQRLGMSTSYETIEKIERPYLLELFSSVISKDMAIFSDMKRLFDLKSDQKEYIQSIVYAHESVTNTIKGILDDKRDSFEIKGVLQKLIQQIDFNDGRTKLIKTLKPYLDLAEC